MTLLKDDTVNAHKQISDFFPHNSSILSNKSFHKCFNKNVFFIYIFQRFPISILAPNFVQMSLKWSFFLLELWHYYLESVKNVSSLFIYFIENAKVSHKNIFFSIFWQLLTQILVQNPLIFIFIIKIIKDCL